MTDWVEVNLPVGPLVGTSETLFDKGLKRPGVLLELENGRKFIVGGFADGSHSYSSPNLWPSSIVKRYRVLWEGE